MSDLSKAVGFDVNILKWGTTQLLGSLQGDVVYQAVSDALKGQDLATVEAAVLVGELEKFIPTPLATSLVSALQSGNAGMAFWMSLAKSVIDYALSADPTLKADADAVIAAIQAAIK